ncbi:hypothetical protein [Streptomyces afghaniensis]|uniref:hypothetical protein n=1 Tax=Streptomyces afghaniensis TaxID=66865 RepID=UPI002787E627|nr:hypothetical protein [Streptomyces afghaniensis]MDQ1019472.1 hypothetical protein [Streptomyces afghaniensis]
MTARNDDDRRDADYDGMDALMAALTDDPLPEGARRDPTFMTAHRAAAADVALLQKQLQLLGDALARDAGTDVTEPEREPRVGEPGAVGDPSVRGALPLGSPAHAGLSGRRGRPRVLGVVLRGLVAAAAATVVVGMGWLVVQAGSGSGGDSGSGSTADAAAGPALGDEGAKVGHAGYLACARLVAEGTVAQVEPVPGTGQDRVTLDVDRSYKPAEGQDRIVFPMDEDVDPLLRPGDHVLVGITRGQAQPDLWSVGEKEIARARAWIAAALPESATLPCE